MLLIGNLLKPLATSALIPLGLAASVSATDVAFQKKMFGSSCPPMLAEHPLDFPLQTIALVFPNEDLNNIVKLIKYLEELGLLIKGVI